jgi:hypothetical protein
MLELLFRDDSTTTKTRTVSLCLSDALLASALTEAESGGEDPHLRDPSIRSSDVCLLLFLHSVVVSPTDEEGQRHP